MSLVPVVFKLNRYMCQLPMVIGPSRLSPPMAAEGLCCGDGVILLVVMWLSLHWTDLLPLTKVFVSGAAISTFLNSCKCWDLVSALRLADDLDNVSAVMGISRLILMGNPVLT
ncbi:hypothetical protein Nepgr_002592 [Nepenthes gracilis]|uniref:Uncharacterized protein n=1 Tax=Nepenthes gracilis TaxID=150966 RepID=A0AAD3RYC2_NEPGR|nr:hypothetical protein Nepgr_002592 [Nepenthes gracilis]